MRISPEAYQSFQQKNGTVSDSYIELFVFELFQIFVHDHIQLVARIGNVQPCYHSFIWRHSRYVWGWRRSHKMPLWDALKNKMPLRSLSRILLKFTDRIAQFLNLLINSGLVFALNVRSVPWSYRLQVFLTAAKILGLTMIIVMGLIRLCQGILYFIIIRYMSDIYHDI